MKIKEIITRHPEVIKPSSTIAEAAHKMKMFDVGLLPVCDGERLVGMVSDRDITIRATAEGRDPQKTGVNEIMTPDVVFCFEDQSVDEVAHLMEERQVRRLPVVNRQKHLVGIVSLGDLAVRTGEERLAGEVLERVSEPLELARLYR